VYNKKYGTGTKQNNKVQSLSISISIAFVVFALHGLAGDY